MENTFRLSDQMVNAVLLFKGKSVLLLRANGELFGGSWFC